MDIWITHLSCSMEFDYKAYWNKRLSGDFGLESVGFLGLGKQFNSWMYEVRRVNFRRTVAKFKVQSPSKILDVGSGSGFYIDLWRKSGHKVTGIDISEQAVSNLQKKYEGCEFYLWDITTHKLNDRDFDIVSCFDVLFHIVDDSKLEVAIENIHGMLKEEGLFFLTDNFVTGNEKRLEHHVSRSLLYYERLLNKKGFTILYRAPVFYFMNFPVDSNSKVLSKLWQVLLKVIPGRGYLGYMAGLMLFFVDTMVTGFLKEGPTTEIMVCTKIKK